MAATGTEKGGKEGEEATGSPAVSSAKFVATPFPPFRPEPTGDENLRTSAAPEWTKGKGDYQSPPNEDFISAMFQECPPGSMPAICSIPGDPTNAKWLAFPAEEVTHRCPDTNNNYFNCSTFRPLDQKLAARKDQFAAYHVLVLDDVGTNVFVDLRDGARARVANDALWIEDRQVASGTTLDPLKVQAASDLARGGLAAQLADLVANTTGFLLDERDLLFEGAGIPWPSTDLDGKDVVVVTGGSGAADELTSLKRYLRRRKPVLIGVDGGADLLLDLGLTPHLVVGDASPRALAKAREVIAKGHVSAAVTVPASTFTTTAASEDFALLLADQAGARTLVLVGYPGTTEQLLDRGRAGAPSALLVRMGLLDRVIGARVAAAMTPRRSIVVPGLVVIVGLLTGQIAMDHWAW